MKRKPLSSKLRFEILMRDGFACQYCGAGAPEVTLHVDHIWPVSAGGTNDPWNLAAACETCNQGKHAYCIEMIEGPLAILDGLHEGHYTLTASEMIKILFSSETDREFCDAVIDASWDEDYRRWFEQSRVALQ